MDNQSLAPPKGAPSPLWRIALAVAVLSTLALIVALWPALWAIGGALASWSGAIAVLLILAGGGLLLGGLGLLAAYGWRLFGHARQAHLVPLPGGLPLRIADVRQIAVQEAHFALDRHYAAQLAEAERATPLLTSQNQHIHIEGGMAPIEDAAQLPQLPQLPSGSGGTLAQFHSAGHVCRSGNSLLVGYSDGQPQYIELPECGFVGIGGQPRVGKSTTSLLIIEQAILSGWHVFIGDPHIQKADGLLSRCRPLSGRLAKQAVTPDEIAIMVRTVDKIGRRRVQGDTDRTPVLLIVDEFSNLVWRDLLPADVLAVLPSMAAEYAGVGVHGVLIAHDWSKASLGGDLGAALRRAITHRLIHRMDPGNTEFLLPKGSSAQARAVQGLEKGRALFYGPDGGVMVTVPWLTDTDAAYAAQGTPPRPYAPRPALAAAAAPAPRVPPTLRVPQQPPRQPAPPTVPMIITVPEQIFDLLRARTSWMTASEIAAALRIDEHVIRTEIKALVNTGQVSRRPCTARTTKERYEYSQSTSQRVSASTALSA
jgi:hypothetical protein